MSCTSILITLFFFNISTSLNQKIRGAPPRHFLLQYKDNMFLVSKYRLTILPESSYIIRESKFLIHYLICCPLSSYSNSSSRNMIQSTNRSSESGYS
jgi:hypothetical protein